MMTDSRRRRLLREAIELLDEVLSEPVPLGNHALNMATVNVRQAASFLAELLPPGRVD